MGVQHPWQSGPTEIIRYALDHLHRPSDFNQRIAFLLLDVGVETLFKTFLELPQEVTGTNLSYGKRREAIEERSFYHLLKAVEEAAGDRLDDINLSHVQFYHDLRNRLYHEGNGITVPVEKAKGYASIAVELLHRLLSVDLQQEVDRPYEIVAEDFEGGDVYCGICNRPVSIPPGVVFALASTLEPVCWRCGRGYASSSLVEAVKSDYTWYGGEAGEACYVAEEDQTWWATKVLDQTLNVAPDRLIKIAETWLKQRRWEYRIVRDDRGVPRRRISILVYEGKELMGAVHFRLREGRMTIYDWLEIIQGIGDEKPIVVMEGLAQYILSEVQGSGRSNEEE